MKLIIAIVRPFTIERLLVAFEDIEDFPGITISDVQGFGRELRTPAYDKLDPFKQKKQILIAAKDESVAQIVASIMANAHTGKKGDGVIFVVPVDESIFI